MIDLIGKVVVYAFGVVLFILILWVLCIGIPIVLASALGG